jgi:hypothetical protein
VPLLFLRRCAHIIGVAVSETTIEIRIAVAMVTANPEQPLDNAAMSRSE